MNSERLNAIASALRTELSDTEIIGKLDQLWNSLQNVISQNHPQHQEALANNLKSVYSALKDAPSDDFSPAWRQLLSERKGDQYFGATLKANIEKIFHENQITPVVANKELRALKDRVAQFSAALNGML